MSTITLAGNTVNGCLGIGSYSNVGSAFSSAKKNTDSLNQSLKSMKSKVDVAASAGDVSTAMCKTQNSISREEQKQSSISLVNDKLDTLISDAGTVDNQASQEVERQKKDFYKKYSYLKPESEKSWAEKVGDAFKGLWDGLCEIGNAIKNFVNDAIEWVKENLETVLKAIAVIALLVVSVLLLATGVGGLLAIAAIGCIVGILGGLLTNGIGNILSGKNFFEGALDAMLIGGITGAIDAVFVAIGHPYVGSIITSVLKNGMECALTGKEFSFKDLLIDVGVGIVLTGVTLKIFTGSFKADSLKDKAVSGTTKWLSKNVPGLNRLAGRGSYSSSYKMVMTKLARGQIHNITWKTIRNGIMPKITKKFLGGLWDIGEEKIRQGISGGLKQLFNIDFDFNIGNIDLFKALKIS